jgi:hypothetical protein
LPSISFVQRGRRERYVGEWLPEPLVTEPTPAEHAGTAEALREQVAAVITPLG